MTQTRAPKQLGDFGEGLVTYALIRKGFEVAYVDHVGADLIAEKNGNRFAISVKTRLFRKNSKESRMVVISSDHLEKLEVFSQQFGMQSIFAQLICLADDTTIHLFMLRSSRIPDVFDKVKHGYSLKFSSKHIDVLINNEHIDYSCWNDELIGRYDFT